MNNFESRSQSLTGLSGLLYTPTAKFEKDGTIIGGMNYYNKNYLSYSAYKYNVAAGYITMTWLPFFEGSIRINRMLNYPPNLDYTFDRMVSFRIKICDEKKYLPAIAVGSHDFIWAFGGNEAIHFNATYLVMTKNFSFFQKADFVQLSGGYSIKIREAFDYQYKGVFGGVIVKPNSKIELIIEHDSFKINAGLKLILFDHLNLIASYTGLKCIDFGISYKYHLLK